VDDHNNLRGVAMNLRILARTGFILTLLIFGALPGLAQGECSAFASEQLTKLNSPQIQEQISGIAKINPDQIKEVQRCLKARGCYDRDPAAVDGIVRQFTDAALRRSAAGQCVAPPPQAESCSVGNDMISWQLTDANIKEISMPDKPGPDKSGATQDPDDQPVEAPPVPPVSKELQAGLDLIKNADYFSMQLFLNDLNYFTLEPIEDPKTKKAVEAELNGRLPGIAGKACKSHPYGKPVATWDSDTGVNEIQALSDPVYAFFPYWGFDESVAPDQGKPEAQAKTSQPAVLHKVDLGALSRIGWFAATFSTQGELDMQPLNHDTAHEILVNEIGMARRYRTDVDLVIYKKLSAPQWLQIASEDPDTFIDNLTRTVADEVGHISGGFMNSVQCWAIPSALTASPTEWDGATMYLDGFPWGDAGAMDFLKSLLRRMRLALYNREKSPDICNRARRQIHLNLVVPYDALYYPDGKPQPEVNPTIAALAQLIPNSQDAIDVQTREAPQVDVVDDFLVFLPQSSSANKKRLRLVIEANFNRNSLTLAAIDGNPKVDLAVWRLQMLRRIIYVLSPETARFKGDYSQAGFQLLDDMIYAKNNFAGVGFMPFPVHDRTNPTLGANIRSVFLKERRDWVERNISPLVEKILGTHVVNLVGARRREIFLLIDTIVFLLLVYFVLSRWIFELRDFFVEHTIPFVAIFLLAVVAVSLLCLFDRNLKQLASYLFASFIIVSAALLALWKYRQYKVEEDLP
jgi:hypothetical protein